MAMEYTPHHEHIIQAFRARWAPPVDRMQRT